jgi:hypothetical protein
MQRLHKFIVWFDTLLLLALLEIAGHSWKLFFWLIPVFFIVFVLSFWQINGRHLNKKFWNIFISPASFISSAVLFFIFLVPQTVGLRHLYIFLVGGLLFFFLHNLNELYTRPDIYRRFTLENLSSHFNLLSVFLFFSSFYTFMFFPPIAFWLTEILVIAIGGILMYQNFWANKIIDPKKRFFIMIIALILAELYLVLAFLPTGFYVNGIILTVVYYILSEISRVYLLGELTTKIIMQRVFIACFVLILIFITTRWS